VNVTPPYFGDGIGFASSDNMTEIMRLTATTGIKGGTIQ
jgi:hypothetical protein